MLPVVGLLAAALVAGCGGQEESAAKAQEPEPPSSTIAAEPRPSAETKNAEPDSDSSALGAEFTLYVGDVALVVGSDISCLVRKRGVDCGEVDEAGRASGRYLVTLSEADVLVQGLDAAGEAEIVFRASHREPSSKSPSEARKESQTVILEPGDAAAVAGTDIVCRAGAKGFVACGLLGERASRPVPGSYGFGIDDTRVTVARVSESGTFEEVFSRTYR